ncbi:hypothetical protein [Geothrix sp. PMB-07]|uniref:hypothetical protein n=1 Tax=Geothrix sp. PMB-07 TaxID=3068640 RepID=UPI002741CE52|nr:hypothetical protein [Geothrix sp. PMB-07]WLT32748.1 hypothetical protein Q9293_05295 [Geothrix sp. PMB-07]
MNIQFAKYAVVLVLGIAIGSIGIFTSGNRKARAFYVQAEHHVPQGYIVAESKSSPKSTVTIDLAGSHASNPGETLRYYFGGSSAAFSGSIFFSYPTSNMPGLGDVFLLNIETPTGKVQSFVVANGGYGTILESSEMVLSYCKNKK